MRMLDDAAVVTMFLTSMLENEAAEEKVIVTMPFTTVLMFNCFPVAGS
jgi:hypothetical protein